MTVFSTLVLVGARCGYCGGRVICDHTEFPNVMPQCLLCSHRFPPAPIVYENGRQSYNPEHKWPAYPQEPCGAEKAWLKRQWKLRGIEAQMSLTLILKKRPKTAKRVLLTYRDYLSLHHPTSYESVTLTEVVAGINRDEDFKNYLAGVERSTVIEDETVTRSECTHHWLIESPKGSTSIGICKLCRAIREFSNSFETALSRAKRQLTIGIGKLKGVTT